MSSSTSIEDQAAVDSQMETPKSANATESEPSSSTTPTTGAESAQQPAANSSSHLEEDLIKEMKNFDNLLRMLSVYRDNPDFRGNPNDRNIEEIARVLSGFIGDDVDNFLSDEDDQDDSQESQAADDNDLTSSNNNEDVDKNS